MEGLKKYKFQIFNYDLVNKFYFKSCKNLPSLKCIVLTFTFKKYEFKNLLSSLVALKLVCDLQRPFILKSKISNINLKIRKGNPVGCKITLRNKKMYKFFFKLINYCLYNLKEVRSFKSNNNSFSFKIKNVLELTKLEQNYQFFKDMPFLNINLVFDSKKRDVLIFWLKAHKFL